ncbi:MAG: DUF2892 domain-containing protein [Acidobacteriota bacterium]|nr:DUF2892 domain-containing protein [Acidobacteriota bacterium]
MDSTQTTLLKLENTTVKRLYKREDQNGINVGETERLASAVGGGALALYGLSPRSWGGLALAILGGSLLYRGTTGHCSTYSALGVNTAKDTPVALSGTSVAESV